MPVCSAVMTSQSVSQSEILQSLGPASRFDQIAVVHQKTKQTKKMIDKQSHQETVWKLSPCVESHKRATDKSIFVTKH